MTVISKLLLRSSILAGITFMGLATAQAQEEPPPEEGCSGTLDLVEDSGDHCCINNWCSMGHPRKFEGRRYVYINPTCTETNAHFSAIGCC